MTITIDDETRPITLYVERIIKDGISMEYTERRRVSRVDIELDQVAARELATHLLKRLESGMKSSIRIRLLGRLVLG